MKTPRAAVIYNPIKGNVERLRKAVKAAEKAAGWGGSIWLETSLEDAGQEATRSVLGKGVTVVLAAGGDGTVRAVAEALRGTGVPIALIPVGTGNLLARNLGLTLTNIEEAANTAFTGHARAIDLGIADVTSAEGDHSEHAFLVMAGVGLDAKMIALTNPKLKKAVGMAGLRGCRGARHPQPQAQSSSGSVATEPPNARRARTPCSWATVGCCPAVCCSCPTRSPTTSCSTWRCFGPRVRSAG